MNHTTLYGKNLTNLLSNKIIEEFNSIDTNHVTNIYVINLGQFIVVKGITTIKNPPNYSQLFSSYCEEILNLNNNFNFNVIDLTEYNYNVKNNVINIDFSVTSNELLKESIKVSNHGFYDIKTNSNYILHNNQKLFNELILIPEFNNYNGIKQKDNSIYISDKLFGLNLLSEKIYLTFLKYISYNLFEKGLCTDINFKLFHVGNMEDLKWDTMEFEINSKSLIVTNEWIKSLILDLFDFNYISIKKHLSLDNYNFSDEILSNDKCWKKSDMVYEIIVL
jgi:hypothetical protein